MAGHDGYTRYTMRIPTPLYDRVKDAAGEASVNSLIVEVLEERFPAPVRWFNLEKYREHQANVEQRSGEIMSEINALTSQYVNPDADVAEIKAKADALFEEHQALFDYDIEDDRFHDFEPVTKG